MRIPAQKLQVLNLGKQLSNYELNTKFIYNVVPNYITVKDPPEKQLPYFSL